jgi:DNA uptake protein ComE-like DNA-binding protein
MERDFEDKVKGHVIGDGLVLDEYRVKVNFTRTPGRKYLKSEDLIPKSLSLTAEYTDAAGKKQPLFSSRTELLPVDLPPDTALGFTQEYVNLSKDNAKKIDTIPGIGPHLASVIVSWRATHSLRTYEDLKQIPGLPDFVVDEIKASKYVTLF